MTTRTMMALLGAAALLAGCATEHHGPEWAANCEAMGVHKGDPGFMQCMEHQQIIATLAWAQSQNASLGLTAIGASMITSPAATGYVQQPQWTAPRPTSCSVNAGFLNCQ